MTGKPTPEKPMTEKISTKLSMKFGFLICLIIAISFFMNSYILSNTTRLFYREGMEQVVELTSQGIYNRIAGVFAEPIGISNAMSRDQFLIDFLSEEEQELDEEYVATLAQYMRNYYDLFQYDAIFFASAATNRYYNYKGIDRMLAKGEAEDVWFYEFLEGSEQYSLNRDNDQAANDEITVFVNSRIMDGDRVLGAIGVGFRIDTMHQILRSYEEEFEVRTMLVDANGVIQVSTDVDMELQRTDLENQGDEDNYRLVRYIPELDWYLIVEKDMVPMINRVKTDNNRMIMLFLVVAAAVCTIISYIMKQYNRRIHTLIQNQERERKNSEELLDSQLYDNVHEFDITHNCPGGPAAERYFEHLDLAPDCTYDEALAIVASRQIKREYQEGYIRSFQREHVLEEYEKGTREISYECMLRTNGEKYRWVKVVAYIYFRETDDTIRIYVSREDIDDRKRREHSRL